MDEAALERLAGRTGEPLARLREWQERGLIRGDDDAVADAERVRLIRFLLGRGFDVELIARANAEQDGLLDRALTLLYPWSPLPEHSLDEVAATARIDSSVAQRLLTAAGLSDRTDGASEDDVQALGVLAAALDAGLPEPAILQLVRVYVDSLQRVAEAEVRLVHFYFHERLRAEGLSEPELTGATRDLSDQLQAAVEPTVLYFHRKGWTTAVRDDIALHVAQAADDSEASKVPGQLMAAVVFTDLARYTPLTEAMGDAAAAEVIERFSDIVRTATSACQGRVVKQIGDEFMLVFYEPRAAVECALAIDERATEESNFPAVRSGAHWGEVLYREGDYFGATVNIAARLGAQAAAHELVVTSTVAKAAGPFPDAEIVSMGRRKLKGLSEEPELCMIRSSRHGPSGRLVDPVCGMGMPADQVVARLEIGGELRAFCSNECLERFVAAPDRYGP